MRLRVSSIDPSINKVRLQEIFEAHGDVVSVKIFRSLDGTTPTLGFIEMKREKEAEAALKALNGFVFGETAMKVEPSNEHVIHHHKAESLPFLDEDDDEDDDDFEDEDDDKIREIPLDELEEEI